MWTSSRFPLTERRQSLYYDPLKGGGIIQLFGKKVTPPETYSRFRINAIAKSELDYALLKEAAFLQGIDVNESIKREVVGQHREEREGVLHSIVPVYADVPNILQALQLLADTKAELFELQSILRDRKATVIFGPAFGFSKNFYQWFRLA